MVNRALLAVVILLAAPRIADACSCPATPPCQTFWIADAVFTGLVTAVTHPSDARPTQTHTETAFVVERGFKGERDQIVIRGDARNELNSCTFKFAVGQRYIVYAARNAEGALYTGKCSGTKLLGDAWADLDYVERLPPPGSGGRIYGNHRCIRRFRPHRAQRTLVSDNRDALGCGREPRVGDGKRGAC